MKSKKPATYYLSGIVWILTIIVFIGIIKLGIDGYSPNYFGTVLIIDVIVGFVAFALSIILYATRDSKLSRTKHRSFKQKKSNNRSEDFTIKINKNILILLANLLLTSGIITYGYNKIAHLISTNNLQNAKPAPTPIDSITPVVVKPSPTIKIVKPKSTPKPIKKVPITIDDGGGLTKGTFYCFEDKVNELASLQNEIRIKQDLSDMCYRSHENEILSCMNDCGSDDSCKHNCTEPFLQQCGNYDVGNLRKELLSKVYEYCP